MRIRPNLVLKLWALVFVLGCTLIGANQAISQTNTLAVSVKQSAEFKNAVALPDQVKDGLHGIAFKFDLSFAHEGKLIFVKPESYRDYAVFCWLSDREGKLVPASTDAISYQGPNGHCRDSLMIRLGNSGKEFKDETMFIPYHAIALDEGERSLNYKLVVMEIKSGKILAESEVLNFAFNKPKTQLVRVGVQRILADSIDVDGEPWDFKFLNPRDIGPDMYWTLRRGKNTLLKSEKQRNQITYIGGADDISSWCQISEGDLLYLSVLDFDLLGYSDQVGALELDVASDKVINHGVNEFYFGAVKSARIKVDAVDFNRIKIKELEINEAATDRGVSGIKVKLRYEIGEQIKDAQPILSLDFLSGTTIASPRMVRVVKGPAVPLGENSVELTGAVGDLELFLPHYAIPGELPEGKTPLLLVTPGLMIGEQFLDFQRLSRQVIRPANPIQDLQFGQWKFSSTTQEGAGGLKVSLDYQFPGAYLEDLPKAKFFLTPQFGGTYGEIALEDFDILGPNAKYWRKNRLELTEGNRNGTLEMFIPFHRLKTAEKEGSLSAVYTCTMKEGDAVTNLGETSRQAVAEIPGLKILHFSVKETAAKKEHWMITDPNLFWVLIVGEDEVFRSPVVYNRKEAKWNDNIEAKIVATANDKVELRILHEGVSDEEDRVIETWKGGAELIPNKPKGATHLHTETLKRLIVRSYWEE